MSAAKGKGHSGTETGPRRRAAVFRPAHVWCWDAGVWDEKDRGWRPGQLLLGARRVLHTGRAMDRTPGQIMLRELLEADPWNFLKQLERLEKTYKGVVQPQEC